jgi:hypothetical protein
MPVFIDRNNLHSVENEIEKTRNKTIAIQGTTMTAYSLLSLTPKSTNTEGTQGQGQYRAGCGVDSDDVGAGRGGGGGICAGGGGGACTQASVEESPVSLEPTVESREWMVQPSY